MYYRIKNQLDLDVFSEILSEEHRKNLLTKMQDAITILDTEYGAARGAFDFGSYVLYFPTAKDYENVKDKIFALHRLDDNGYEFEDIIYQNADDNIVWKQRLYLISSEDSLILFFPEVVKLA